MSERRVLAESAVTRVEVCDCGACYLTVGPVMLTLHPGALAELARTVNRAVRALRATELPASPTAAPRDDPSAEPDASQAEGDEPGVEPPPSLRSN